MVLLTDENVAFLVAVSQVMKRFPVRFNCIKTKT